MARLLETRGIPTETSPTSGPGAGAKLARDAVAAGADLIVSYGGDGTLNEIIQSIAGTNVPLAIWAGGTANVAARDLGLPSSPERLAGVIAAGKTRRIALGVAKAVHQPQLGVQEPDTAGVGSAYTSGPSQKPADTAGSEARPDGSGPRGHYFFMFAGIGLDAAVCRLVNHRLKRAVGQLAYVVSGLEQLIDWRPEPFTVEVDGKRFETCFALVANGKSYGGGIKMTPSARLEDPWFELFMIPPDRTRSGLIWDAATCLLGMPGRSSAMTASGRSVTANSSLQPWVEVDGEVLAQLPMSFQIEPDALTVIVP